MGEKVIYQSERTIEEVQNEMGRLQRLEEPLGEPQQFILDKQRDLYDELEALIEAEDERRLKELRGMLKNEAKLCDI